MGRHRKHRDEISDTERHFCYEYLANGRNGREAWQTVHPGTCCSTARTEASKCLAKPNIKAYLRYLQEKQNRKLEISINRTIIQIAQIAYLFEGFKGKALEEMISKFGRIVLAALHMLAKIQGLYDRERVFLFEKQEITGPLILPPPKTPNEE